MPSALQAFLSRYTGMPVPETPSSTTSMLLRISQPMVSGVMP